MTNIFFKSPIQVNVEINELLNGTYSFQSRQYQADTVNDKGIITYTLLTVSVTPARFEQIFSENLTGLSSKATIDIYLKDENGNVLKEAKGEKIDDRT